MVGPSCRPIHPFSDRTLDIDSATQIALKNWPEIAQRRLDVETRASTCARVAKTDRMPELDSTFSYGLVGQQAGYGGTR